MTSPHLSGRALYEKIRRDFIGLDTSYSLATGEKKRRVYLDSTATTLMMRPAHEVVNRFFRHYANTHSLLHFGAKISTREYEWAHRRILSFVNADPETYTCFFTGSGTTAGVNRMARVFRDIRPGRKTALVTIMEHHSNDLPHRKHMEKVIHVPVTVTNGRMGCVSLQALESMLKENRDTVNYVAMTGVSNVTGIINPINEAAEIAHAYGALLLVDGAQLLAHIPVRMTVPDNPQRNIDALAFSGHKTYMPGSPGGVVARKDLLSQVEPEEVGGGMVEHVFKDSYEVKSTFPDREEAGTPNIPGTIGLATAIDILDRIGMDFLRKEEEALIGEALDRLQKIPDVTVYGEADPRLCERTASISFNVMGMDHGLVAAILNDYFNIAVRNECFCAHPYVKEMIGNDLIQTTHSDDPEELERIYHLKQGMVRASFALYSTREDVQALETALKEICRQKDRFRVHYHVDAAGNYVHNSFQFDHSRAFSVQNCLVELIS
ncbi:MAG: aminotransferase class V-fold PLP-dependent enzyme [Fidelibacterota bacterium]